MHARRPDYASRRGIDVNLRSGPQMLEYEAIVHRIRADRPERVLDWGCGHGQVTDLLWRAGVNVTAFDYRPDGGEGVQPLERYPHLSAHVSPDPRRLPFEDRSFDAVLSCGVLEHVEDPDASLEEIKRILVPGGTFYVYKLPNRRSYLEAIARRAGLYHHGALEHDRVYDLTTAQQLLVRHGFTVGEARYANMLPLTVTGSLATRAAGPIWRVNGALSSIPGLSRFATNVELVARTSPPPDSAPVARGDRFQRSAQRQATRVEVEPLRGRIA
jgi:SAM-dependent methyltransferase